MIQSFDEAIRSSSGKILILSIIAIPVCILATILRIVGTWRADRKLSWDDGFAIAALISFMPYAISPLAGVVMAETMDDPMEFAQKAVIMAYAVTPFFYLNQLFARGSLLVLYYRIFWSNGVFLRWVYGLAAIHVGWFITFFFMELFLCNPVSLWWDITGEQEGTCLDGNTFLVAEEGINSSLDFAVLAIAVYVVWKVMTRKNVKTKLTFIFLVGGLSGVIGFVKIGIVYQADNDAGQENDTNAFWDILQMATSIFCTCAPIYRSMLPLGAIWLRVKSSTQYLASKSKIQQWTTLRDSSKSKSRRKGSDGHGSGSDEGKLGGIGQGSASNSTEGQAFYIGAAESGYTWSQFDRADNIHLPMYNTKSGTENAERDQAKSIKVARTVEIV